MTPKIRMIIAGSRKVEKPMQEEFKRFLDEVLDKLGGPDQIEFVITGGAKGADELGRLWAISRGLKSHEAPARWNTEGNLAGKKRNWRMAKLATANKRPLLVVCWDGMSPGTAHMVAAASSINMQTIIFSTALKCLSDEVAIEPF